MQGRQYLLSAEDGITGYRSANGNCRRCTTCRQSGLIQEIISEQDRLSAMILNGNLFIVMLTFTGLGLLLAFTPCVLPMVPILSGIIAGQGKQCNYQPGLFIVADLRARHGHNLYPGRRGLRRDGRANSGGAAEALDYRWRLRMLFVALARVDVRLLRTPNSLQPCKLVWQP